MDDLDSEPGEANKKPGFRGSVQFMIIAMFGAALLYVLTEPQPGAMEKWEGVKAPEIEAATLDGANFSLNELRGKRVMLDFWATWCPPCIAEVPDLIALDEKLGDEYVIVGISDEEPDVVRAFAEKEGIDYRLVAGEAMPEPYRYIQSIPTKVIIDRNGVIQHVLVGLGPPSELEELLTGDDFEGRARPAPYHEGSVTDGH